MLRCLIVEKMADSYLLDLGIVAAASALTSGRSLTTAGLLHFASHQLLLTNRYYL